MPDKADLYLIFRAAIIFINDSHIIYQAYPVFHGKTTADKQLEEISGRRLNYQTGGDQDRLTVVQFNIPGGINIQSGRPVRFSLGNEGRRVLFDDLAQAMAEGSPPPPAF